MSTEETWASLGYIRLSDTVEEALIRRLETVGRELSRASGARRVVVRGHSWLITIVLNTCSHGVDLPSVEGSELHVKVDSSLERTCAVVEAQDEEGSVLLSRVVHHTPGMSEGSNQVFSQLLEDGVEPERADSAARLLG